MREIEFRGKDKETGKFVFGSLLNFGIDGVFIAVFGAVFGVLLKFGNEYVRYEVDRKTIGEYTGLKDKNGVKIFEGDIVKTHDQIGKVIYRCSSFIVDFGDNWLAVHSFYENEVIGNIHDNPELLDASNE